MNFESRISTHKRVSEQLAKMTDGEIEDILLNATSIGRGIGGPVSSLLIGNSKIFVKRIHLADIERQSNNHRATRNYFSLPVCYQYGVGSAGFGSWRELLAHELTTSWVLEKRSPNFPILFHSRILPRSKREPIDLAYYKGLDGYVSYWNESLAIRERMTAINGATADIVLFLEFIEQTLDQWLISKRNLGTDFFLSAVETFETGLISSSKFLRANEMVHFDGHPKNILVSEDQLHFSDFGLATSSKFSLSSEELEFFKAHRNYDIGFSAFILVYETLRTFFEDDRTHISSLIQRASNGNQIDELPSKANSLLKRYSPIAEVMDNFFGKIQKDKMTVFPSSKLAQACEYAGLGCNPKE